MSCPLSYSLSVSGDCGNTSSGAFSLDIFGTSAFTITWINPALGVIVLPANNYTVTGLSGGTYTFQVTDSCSSPLSQTQTLNVNISTGTCVNVTALGDTTCNLDNGYISVATSNYYGVGYFDLYKQGTGLISSITAYSQTYTFNNLSGGFYYVVANDGGGCTGKTETCLIKSSSTIDYGIYVVDDSPCIAQTGAMYITGLTGTPPYTYLWSNYSTNNFVTGLTSGVYSVTVTDSLGCTLTLSRNVGNAPPLGVASITSVNPTCGNNDGSATVYLTGGTGPFFYSGSNGETVVTFSDTYTFTGLTAQVFDVFVQDAGFCIALGSAMLMTPNSFFAVALTTTNSTCNGFGGQLTINLFGTPGNYTYAITDSSGNTTSVTVPAQSYTFTGLYSGNYTITISNSGPCSFTDTFTITNSDLFTLSTSTTGTTCGLSDGAVTVDITGTYTGPYTFEIPGQAYSTAVSSFTFTNLASGNYIATVTDSSACAQTIPFTIPSSSSVDFILSSTDSTNGTNGQITAFITNGTPPFTLNWSPNVNGQIGYTVTSLSAGTYTLQVTDSNGCTMIRSVILNGYSRVTASSDYTVSDGDVELTGENQRTGPEQMLIDGFYELTTEDYNCVLNKALFELITEVDGVKKSKVFYTGVTLSSYPDDVIYAQVLKELLLSYPIIEDVQIDTVGNKIRIQTDCSVSEDVDGVPIKAYLKIINDISCEICGMKQFQDLENFYFMDGEPYFFMSQ